MKNFDWTSYTKKIAIRADLQSIYDAWTKSYEIEKWFLKKASFYDKDQKMLEQNVNVSFDCRYEWQWHLYDEPVKGTIIDENGKDHVRFTFEGESMVDVNLE